MSEFLMTPEDMAKEVSPLGRYAHGSYFCKCTECKRQYIGDKRSTSCLPCAVGALLAAFHGRLNEERSDTTTAETKSASLTPNPSEHSE